MHYSLNVSVPKYVCVSQGASDSLVRVLNKNESRDVVIVYTGANTKKHVDFLDEKIKASRVGRAKGEIVHYLLAAASSDEAHKLDAYCSDFNKAPILLGVGGGSCIDVVKLVASRRKLMLLIYPTVLSSDCLTSPISVLQDHGQKTRVEGAIPNGIFIDTNITAKAPKNLILSGIADLMSNASALLDLERHKDEHDEIEFASLLSKAAVNHVLSMRRMNITRPRFQGALAQGLILSGLSMNFAGSSVTASGSEHLISHAMDSHGSSNATHGQQVYIGMLCSDLIRKYFDESTVSNRLMKALLNFGLEKKVTQYGIDKADLIRAIQEAPNLRPERKTILNRVGELTGEQIGEIIAPLF